MDCRICRYDEALSWALLTLTAVLVGAVMYATDPGAYPLPVDLGVGLIATWAAHTTNMRLLETWHARRCEGEPQAD